MCKTYLAMTHPNGCHHGMVVRHLCFYATMWIFGSWHILHNNKRSIEKDFRFDQKISDKMGSGQDDHDYIRIYHTDIKTAPSGFKYEDGAFANVSGTPTNANMPTLTSSDTLWVRATCNGTSVTVKCATSGSNQENVCERFFWALCDANYNILGLVTKTGTLAKRYEYTPYGQRKVFSHGWMIGDCDEDGDVDIGDLAAFVQPFVIHSRLAHLQRSAAAQDHPRRLATVADRQPMATLIDLMTMLLDVLRDFLLDRLLKHPAGALASNVFQNRHGCQSQRKL